MENAPVARGWFLGDYQGLAAIGNDLALFFAVSTDSADSADVIAIRADGPLTKPPPSRNKHPMMGAAVSHPDPRHRTAPFFSCLLTKRS